MKLMRNEHNGTGKYALVRLDKMEKLNGADKAYAEHAMSMLGDVGLLELGAVGTEEEFFVIKLKDRIAPAALMAYAAGAALSDTEYASEVAALAGRAQHHKNRKDPD